METGSVQQAVILDLITHFRQAIKTREAQKHGPKPPVRIKKMTEAHAGATLIAEQNWVQFVPCKASLRDAEQALAAIFGLNWVFLTFRGRKLLYPLPYSA